MTVKTRQDVDDWLEKREIALANSLVEQGKFAQALEVFQRYEGQNGVNVILVEELWIMRYLSAALVDRDRGYVILADGYAFGCALELLSSMKVRDAISPFFAVKVAELIQGSKLIGAEPYVQEVYRLFSSMGYEYPASILRNCLGLSKDSRPPVKPTKIVVADEAVKAGEQGDAIVLIPPGQYSDDYWQQMHRTFFYIEQEDYGIAVRELNLLLGRLDDRSRASDVFVLRGYCQFLAQDELEAERSFKLASRIRASNDEFRLHKTCLCIYLLYQTPREMHKYLRMLVEPTLAHKDVFKIATQLVGQQFNEDTKFTARLADELLRRAERGEKTQHALRIYRAVLCMLGIKNNERRLQVIMCLDGIGKHRSAARVYRCYQDFTFEDELVQQLVLRHMRSEKIDQVCQNYLEYAGLNLAAIVPQIRQEQILGVLTRVLRGYAPRRFLLNVRQDLIALHDRGQFNQDFAQSLTHQIVQETMADERAEMRSRFRNDLLAIARVVDNVDGNSGLTIRHALDFGTASSAQEKDSSMEELFIH